MDMRHGGCGNVVTHVGDQDVPCRGVEHDGSPPTTAPRPVAADVTGGFSCAPVREAERMTIAAGAGPSMHPHRRLRTSARHSGMTPRVGEDFIETKPSITGDDIALGVVDFSIFPHLDYPDFPENTMAAAEKWAAGLGCPAYAIDDQTAIKVVDGTVEVVSEGHWKFFGR